MILELQPDQLSLCQDPAEKFFVESGIAGKFHFPHFCQTWGHFIAAGVGIILLHFQTGSEIASGIIGGIVSPCPLTDDVIAQETFWWIDPSLRSKSPAGIQLLKAWEKRVIGCGASRIYVGNLWKLNSSSMQKLYARLGYEPLEIHYVKKA